MSSASFRRSASGFSTTIDRPYCANSRTFWQCVPLGVNTLITSIRSPIAPIISATDANAGASYLFENCCARPASMSTNAPISASSRYSCSTCACLLAILPHPTSANRGLLIRLAPYECAIHRYQLFALAFPSVPGQEGPSHRRLSPPQSGVGVKTHNRLRQRLDVFGFVVRHHLFGEVMLNGFETRSHR